MNKHLKLVLIFAGLFILASSIFFIITATTSKPVSINLYMPKDNENDSTANKYLNYKSKLTLVLLKNDNLFGYYGENISDGKNVPVSNADQLIKDGIVMYSIDSLYINIKPAKEASYKSTVDILDLMALNSVKNYSMSDVGITEKEFLKIKE